MESAVKAGWRMISISTHPATDRTLNQRKSKHLKRPIVLFASRSLMTPILSLSVEPQSVAGMALERSTRPTVGPSSCVIGRPAGSYSPPYIHLFRGHKKKALHIQDLVFQERAEYYARWQLNID
ncbi:hypothetical protein I7I50_11167 [Histoplasma capsulatum G186AR]|uniref:Uncharacterized protein n=1 Tax=Ajellomyces capsulatus TaxID=5037 RepID=A0A8H7Z587_AJECA|nr:hypothetical protein I7I52_02405 [Histoplasma capsulatum]QSS69761.1 hypothetical protein I7I50_11167 [Histoplasma capsulatum G186AR]